MPIIPSGGTGIGIGSLTHYSVSVVLMNDQTNWADSSRKAIQDAYDAKQELLGAVVFHNALGDNQNWPLWYKELAGGLLVLDDQEGMKKTTITPGSSYDVHAVGDHSIIKDIGAFRVTGEDAYKGVWQSPKITPLLEATGPSTDRVVAWVGPNPDMARVVVISPGTSPETFRNREFRRLVRNSILWAGHRLD
jgi:type 1 glutamine amidotransferase